MGEKKSRKRNSDIQESIPRIGIYSVGLCSLAGRYDNPIPTWFLTPVGCSKIPALMRLSEQSLELVSVVKEASRNLNFNFFFETGRKFVIKLFTHVLKIRI
jgi:hypothetical protein